jgi:hypothetical protein
MRIYLSVAYVNRFPLRPRLRLLPGVAVFAFLSLLVVAGANARSTTTTHHDDPKLNPQSATAGGGTIKVGRA